MDHMVDGNAQHISTEMLLDLVRKTGLVQTMSAEVIKEGSALTAIRVFYRTRQGDKEAIVSRKEIEELRERTSRGAGLWESHYEKLAIRVAMKCILLKVCQENALQLLTTSAYLATQVGSVTIH